MMGDGSGDEEMDEEKLGPLWPWARYKECVDDKGVPRKRPDRKLCSICKLIFSGAAYLHKRGSISNYVKKITEKPDEHTSFMTAFRAWCQQMVADPNADWEDLLIAANEAATTVGEQKNLRVQQLFRQPFAGESA